jgi:hypothetical protein
MAKYLHSIQLDADASIHEMLIASDDFSLGMVSDCFTSELHKLQFSNIAKVQIHLTENPSLDRNIQKFIDVILIHRYLNKAPFLSDSLTGKREFMVQLIYDSLVCVGEFLNASTDALHDVYQRAAIKINNFRGNFGKKYLNKKIGYGAQLYFIYEKNIEVGLSFESAQNDDFNLLLFYHPAVLDAVLKMFGKIEWRDSGKLILHRKNTDDFWCVDIYKRAVEFVFARAEARDPHGMYDLGMLYLKGYLVEKNNDKANYWFQQASLKGYGKADKALLGLKK